MDITIQSNFFLTFNNLVFYWSSKILKFIYLSEFFAWLLYLHNQDEKKQGAISS